MKLYYESEATYFGKPGKYWMKEYIMYDTLSDKLHQELMRRATQVWIEDECGVRYYKKPFEYSQYSKYSYDCDLEEFIVVKLKSIPL
jgi:hypothetical protein